MLLGVDVGTTHCKVGVFRRDGSLVSLASQPTPTRQSSEGFYYYDPHELWQSVTAAMREALCDAHEPVVAVGIASMAETGLFVDRGTGEPHSIMTPWFDTSAQPYADLINRHADGDARFFVTGIGPSFKCGLAKMLWLRARDPQVTYNAVWLGAADYIAFRLTGCFATDHSLAGRTAAFRLADKRWDEDWIRQLDLAPDLFPDVGASTRVVGRVCSADFAEEGLRVGMPVSIAGHDHVCAALAVGAIRSGVVFDSMGTAEALFGTLDERPLGERERASRLAYGCHVVRGHLYWMGGLSAAGGSLEWLRALLGDPPLSYADVQRLLENADGAPTGILYFPYLAGGGTAQPDARVRAAFVGLTQVHTRADLLRAALEGTAYEMEMLRRTAVAVMDSPITRIVAVGGGTKNRVWMQIKADVSNCPFEVPALAEATLLGAALVAGIASGVYAGADEAVAAVAHHPRETFEPDAARHARDRDLLENGYLPLQEPLRDYFTR